MCSNFQLTLDSLTCEWLFFHLHVRLIFKKSLAFTMSLAPSTFI